MNRGKKNKGRGGEAYPPDPPPISEDDINRGMINLLNKGIVPKDVDLTPAFERGAAPLQLKPAKIHLLDPREASKREIATGANF